MVTIDDAFKIDHGQFYLDLEPFYQYSYISFLLADVAVVLLPYLPVMCEERAHAAEST